MKTIEIIKLNDNLSIGKYKGLQFTAQKIDNGYAINTKIKGNITAYMYDDGTFEIQQKNQYQIINNNEIIYNITYKNDWMQVKSVNDPENKTHIMMSIKDEKNPYKYHIKVISKHKSENNEITAIGQYLTNELKKEDYGNVFLAIIKDNKEEKRAALKKINKGIYISHEKSTYNSLNELKEDLKNYHISLEYTKDFIKLLNKELSILKIMTEIKNAVSENNENRKNMNNDVQKKHTLQII